MAQNKNELEIKKIKPYPFAGQFSKGTQVFTGNVIKLVMHGFITELGSVVVKVGDVYQMQFTLPSENQLLVSEVKVIKTYDKYQLNPNPATKAARLAEFHFVQPTEELRKKIKHFLKAIKQIGTDLV